MKSENFWQVYVTKVIKKIYENRNKNEKVELSLINYISLKRNNRNKRRSKNNDLSFVFVTLDIERKRKRSNRTLDDTWNWINSVLNVGIIRTFKIIEENRNVISGTYKDVGVMINLYSVTAISCNDISV